MYQGGHGIQAYKQARVTTADPKGLVLMCYEGAISSLKLAKEKYLSHEYELKAQALQKTHDILNILMQSLDFEKGKTIAAGLNSLYSYMMRRVMEGDLQNNMEAFDEVIGMLEELESAWKEISTTPRSNSASDSHVTILPEKKKLEVSGVIGGAF
jgi:flagellar protein FliS